MACGMGVGGRGRGWVEVEAGVGQGSGQGVLDAGGHPQHWPAPSFEPDPLRAGTEQAGAAPILDEETEEDEDPFGHGFNIL